MSNEPPRSVETADPSREESRSGCEFDIHAIVILGLTFFGGIVIHYKSSRLELVWPQLIALAFLVIVPQGRIIFHAMDEKAMDHPVPWRLLINTEIIVLTATAIFAVLCFD